MIDVVGRAAIEAAVRITTFYLLADPAKAQRLKKEHNALQPPESFGLLSYNQLSKRPCLYALVSEGLRLSKESNRMPRINQTLVI